MIVEGKAGCGKWIVDIKTGCEEKMTGKKR